MAELKPRDITMSTAPFFGPTGAPVTQTIVQFWVGTHGPFQLRYKSDEVSSLRIREDIDKQVQLLREVEAAAL